MKKEFVRIILIIVIPLPGEEGRKKLFEINLRNVPLATDIDWNFLVKATEGYSGSDITNVIKIS